jgi:hypothetical protein
MVTPCFEGGQGVHFFRVVELLKMLFKKSLFLSAANAWSNKLGCLSLGLNVWE